ncbi:MAG: integrase arm-type DNA-binding domain-containing protein [Pseudomonadota bacterium]
MAITRNKLTVRAVGSLNTPGMHSDGGGLYLKVLGSGARSWIFRYRRAGRRRDMGLGPWPTVSLKDARIMAQEASALLMTGADPILKRNAKLTDEAAKRWTFGAYADDYVASLEGSYKSEKHFKQWKRSVEELAASLRSIPLAEVTNEDVLACLKTHWKVRHATARRLRGRLERIFDAARAQGLYRGENPARWKGHLESLLPVMPKSARRRHAAMDYQDAPDFMVRLKKRTSLSARLLEFVVLTGTRTSEGRLAEWNEFDFDAAEWRIPMLRMKGSEEHIVPLSPQAIDLLERIREYQINQFVFPGRKPNQPLSHGACLRVLRQLGETDTTHGFRSTFRDFAGDKTETPREIAEAALSHKVGNDVEQAYRRKTALERRRVLMCQWADFLLPRDGAADVISLSKGASR